MNISNIVRVETISPRVYIGNVDENLCSIADCIRTEKLNNSIKETDIIVTPELSLTGYTIQDMVFNSDIIRQINDIIYFASRGDTVIQRVMDANICIVGAPVEVNNTLYNCAIVLSKNTILGIVPKCYLPNYNEFYEQRWFSSGFDDLPSSLDIFGQKVAFGRELVFETHNYKFGVELCEDLWSPNPPSVNMSLNGAEIILNLSASNELIGKSNYRRELVKQQSARCICGYVYCSAGSSESTSDVVFSGHNIIAENGSILAESELFDNDRLGKLKADIDLDVIRHDRRVNKTFSFCRKAVGSECRVVKANSVRYTNKKETLRKISVTPFVPSHNIIERCNEIFNIQTEALARRWKNTGSKHLVIGVSGGLDSTLALLVCAGAADKLGYNRERIIGLTMPCFGTTSRTKDNALELMKQLEITTKEVNIADSVKQHLKDLGLSEDDRSIAYENAQARERTQLLMDYANMIGGFVVGTGDLSELALGWCTYNGDHMSMYSVNSSIPKTLVRELVNSIRQASAGTLLGKHSNEALDKCLLNILDTPVSPELLPPSKDGKIAQLTEDSVGPYVLNDFFLFYTLRYGFSKKKILAYAVNAFAKSDYNFDCEEIEKWLSKFYTRFARAQFKRNCCPDGIKVGSVSLSPRGDWRMASEFDIRGIDH